MAAGTENSLYNPQLAGTIRQSGVLYKYARGLYQSKKTTNTSLYSSSSLGQAGLLRVAGVTYSYAVGELYHPIAPIDTHIYTIWGYDQEDLPKSFIGKFFSVDLHGTLSTKSKEKSIYETIGYLPVHDAYETRFTGYVRDGYLGRLNDLTGGQYVDVVKTLSAVTDKYKGIIRNIKTGVMTLEAADSRHFQYVVEHVQEELMDYTGHLTGGQGSGGSVILKPLLPRRYPSTYIPTLRRNTP